MTPYDHEILWVLLRMGIPKRLLLALKEPRDTLAFQVAQSFCEDDSPARWLALIGPVGCGKSVAAAEVCRWWLHACGLGNRMTGQLEHLHWLRAGELTMLSQFSADHEAWCGDLERYRLLVVDDMGEEGSELGRRKLLDILMARHAARRRTVLTSNLRLEAFVHRYGNALLDRIRELGEVPALGSESSLRVAPERTQSPKDFRDVKQKLEAEREAKGEPRP